MAHASISLLLVAAAVALAGCGGRGSGESAAAAQDSQRAAAPVRVRTVAAATREVPVTLLLDGTLLADEESHVTSVVGGRVTAVLVERGAAVAEGDPLVRLRDVDYRLQARAARAALDQARARLGVEEGGQVPRPDETAEVRAAQTDRELAESNLRRAEELAQRGVLSTQQLEEARARAAAARDRHQMALQNARGAVASLESNRVMLTQAATAASEATVRAPFAGEIAQRSISVGEFVSPQTPLVTLVRTDPLRIELQVPQQHLLAVRVGQQVHVTIDAVPGRTFEGTIRYVSASVERNTRGLTVEAMIPNPERLLRPGLFAAARIDTGTTQTAAVIPEAAVMRQAGVSRAFVIADGVVQERVIAIAERRGDEVVVADGVRAGEKVAVGGLERLADGVRVVEGS